MVRAGGFMIVSLLKGCVSFDSSTQDAELDVQLFTVTLAFVTTQFPRPATQYVVIGRPTVESMEKFRIKHSLLYGKVHP